MVIFPLFDNEMRLVGLIIYFLLSCVLIQAQESSFAKFKKLSAPEQRWVIFHPFIAKKTYRISQEVRLVTDSIHKSKTLDNYPNGGKVDAFRHGYWMASLSSEIGKHRALSLGKAHEKGNKNDYRSGSLEEGLLPDKVSVDMDLYNNKIGVEIKAYNKQELQKAVLQSIENGEFKIIKRDGNGNFLDTKGNSITNNQWQGKWVNDRCLVPSNWHE